MCVGVCRHVPVRRVGAWHSQFVYKIWTALLHPSKHIKRAQFLNRGHHAHFRCYFRGFCSFFCTRFIVAFAERLCQLGISGILCTLCFHVLCIFAVLPCSVTPLASTYCGQTLYQRWSVLFLTVRVMGQCDRPDVWPGFCSFFLHALYCCLCRDNMLAWDQWDSVYSVFSRPLEDDFSYSCIISVIRDISLVPVKSHTRIEQAA